MRHFDAKAVAAVELADVNTFAVVLAEADDGSGQRLELQRALVVNDEDRERGWGTYCLVTDDGATVYGGLSSWKLDGDTLRIVLEHQAAAALGTDGFVIRYPREQHDVLHEGLARVLNASS